MTATTGLWVTGDTITAAGLNDIATGNEVVYPRSTTIGDYTAPTAATGSTTKTATVSATYNATSGSAMGTVKAALGASWAQRIGQKFTTGSTMIGVSFNQVIISLSKTLSPTGTITVNIRDGSDVIQASGTLSAASLTGSYADYTVVLNALVTIAANWRVSIEYSGGDGTNYVNVGGKTTGIPANSNIFEYYSAAYNDESGQAMRLELDTQYVAANVYDGNTSSEWQSTNTTNPNIYVQISSAADQTPCGVAIYWDGTNSTSTQIRFDIGDATPSWTTVRTINTSLLTNGAWNYIRWNPSTTLAKYLRVYATDGGSVVLAIYEIKVLQPTALQIAATHGHKTISSSNATLVVTT